MSTIASIEQKTGKHPIKDLLDKGLQKPRWAVRKLSIEEPDLQALINLKNKFREEDRGFGKPKLADRLYDVLWLLRRTEAGYEGNPKLLEPTITQAEATELVESIVNELGFSSAQSLRRTLEIYSEHFKLEMPT